MSKFDKNFIALFFYFFACETKKKDEKFELDNTRSVKRGFFEGGAVIFYSSGFSLATGSSGS